MKLPSACTFAIGASLVSLYAQPGLTIYNQNFAVVRDSVPLELKKGETRITYDGATVHVEPDSVILREPGGAPIPVLEQNYRNDPVTQQLLLSLFEGKEIDFFIREANKPDRTIRGKIIRSGYVPHSRSAMTRYGQNYAANQIAMAAASGTGQPIIEVDGTIRFGLPGEPIFPSLGDDTILKPQLSWIIASPKEVSMNAELGYITGGMSWEASYNVIMIGWVTMDNQSGRDFVDARIKLMAGDVNKVQPQMEAGAMGSARFSRAAVMDAQEPGVTEKAFDEYHLYTLERPSTLRDRETKQVEFVRAGNVSSETIYVYDGLSMDPNRWRGADASFRRTNEEFGTQSQTKVAVMREFKNTAQNGLGIPQAASAFTGRTANNWNLPEKMSSTTHPRTKQSASTPATRLTSSANANAPTSASIPQTNGPTKASKSPSATAKPTPSPSASSNTSIGGTIGKSPKKMPPTKN